MRRGYQEGSLREHRPVWWNYDVHWHRRANDEGAHCPCAVNNEDQGCCASGEEVLCVDWWLHPFFVEHLPADVDLQGRVRRVWADDCPQEVLLRTQHEYVEDGVTTHCFRVFCRAWAVVEWKLFQCSWPALDARGHLQGEM